jgi:dolichyl-phosphate-mannose-protein mannosyltransferase
MEGTSEKRAGEDNRLKNPIIASSPSPLTVSETAHAFQKDSLSPLTGRRQGRWALLFLLPLSFFIRGRNLRNPPFAVQEESQIAANINKYYDGSFFLNDEPPLSTQIYYGISRVLGFHGTSTYFETEQAFADTEFPFYGLRWVSVVEGVIVVVLTFEILCHYRLTRASVILGSLLVLFENSFATQHRYIFTQPQLLFVDIVHIYLWAALSSTTLCKS